MHTISLVDADESKCGETPYIREVLRGGWVIPHIVRSDQVSAMTEQMTGSDEPFEIACYFSNWFGFAAANQAGVRVLLDGISGDHITPPYVYLATLVRSFKWSAVLKELSFCFARVYGGPRLSNSEDVTASAPAMPRAICGLAVAVEAAEPPPYPEGFV